LWQANQKRNLIFSGNFQIQEQEGELEVITEFMRANTQEYPLFAV